MSRIVVLGIGSRVMKDDGIAVKVLEAIAGRLAREGIEVILGETDFSYCLNAVNGDDFLIVLDAMDSGAKPGSIRVCPLTDALLNHRRINSQHNLSLLDLLPLRYPNLNGYLIGIETGEVGLGLELSSTLKERFTVICQEVAGIIRAMVKEQENA